MFVMAASSLRLYIHTLLIFKQKDVDDSFKVVLELGFNLNSINRKRTGPYNIFLKSLVTFYTTIYPLARSDV